MLYSIVLTLTGLLLSVVLFYRFPRLSKASILEQVPRISVIIPARNEERNLPLLLQDLKMQICPLFEIICIDDGSTDNTPAIIRAAGAICLTASKRPTDWTGKAWACQTGANAAGGDLLLFLDADVRLEPAAIAAIAYAAQQQNCTISVQPYHQTIHWYEQLSLFFNMIELAANGISSAFRCRPAGLSGPVICMKRTVYEAIDGHCAARSSVVDDLALGIQLHSCGFSFQLLTGADLVSYRMYSGGFRDLWHGWSKNYATGAAKTHLPLLALIFVWVTACITAPAVLVQTLLSGQWYFAIVFGLIYGVWVLELLRISRRVGRFKAPALILYPFALFFFLAAFAVSLYKRIFGGYVTWKGRKIKLDA